MPPTSGCGDALERLAAEAAADEASQALVAVPGARGSTRSSAMRSFPARRRAASVASGQSAVGASRRKPSGSGWRRPPCTTYGPALAVARADQPVGEAEALAQRERPRLLGDESSRRRARA